MSEYTPFKMKGSPMKRNFGIGSPMRDERSETATGKAWGQEGAVKAYEKSTSGISADMSKKDLKEYVLKTNKGKSASDSARLNMKSAIQLWRKKQELAKSKTKKSEIKTENIEEKKVVKKAGESSKIGDPVSYEESLAYDDYYGLRSDDAPQLSDERRAQITAYLQAPWADDKQTHKVGYPKDFWTGAAGGE